MSSQQIVKSNHNDNQTTSPFLIPPPLLSDETLLFQGSVQSILSPGVITHSYDGFNLQQSLNHQATNYHPPLTNLTASPSQPLAKLTLKLKLIHPTTHKITTHKRIRESAQQELKPSLPNFSTTKNKKQKQYDHQQPGAHFVHDDPSIDTLPRFEELCNQDGDLPSHLVLQLQTSSCIKLPAHLRRYKCSDCIGKQAGFICAFRMIRQWICQRNFPQVLVGGPTFPDFNTHPTQLGYQFPQFPSKFNRLPTKRDLNGLRQLLARILLPSIKSEMAWLKDPKVKFIGRQIDLVTKCDYCSATLIGAAWLCSQCGAEACVNCFELMSFQAEAVPLFTNDKNHKGAHTDWLHRLTTCTKFNKSRHDPQAHIKISHITLGELEELHQQMIFLTNQSTAELDQTSSLLASPHLTPMGADAVPPDLEKFLYQPEGDHSEPYIKIDVNELEADPSIFNRLWSTGQMLLVTGMKDRMKLEWTPSYFVQHYTEDTCQRIDSNNTDQIPNSTTVDEFFKDFEKEPSEIGKVWKLRDWPPEVDFQNKFPQLFHDFQQALPVADITTRFGIHNVAAHFPTNANVPDIGPKMYIGMKNSDHIGSHGSTVLHMDVADAINIQTYAKTSEGENAGCALWNLYHARDAEKLREFLYQYQSKCFGLSAEEVKTHFDDPIHTARIYIDAEMRKTLHEQFGVKGWEVKQKPGEAVLIPAYTAHQVCNLANCIKVAADFVSPHSIQRCIKLTEEFKLQNHEHRKPWREDILQINQMLLYAFQSTSRKLNDFQVKEDFP